MSPNNTVRVTASADGPKDEWHGHQSNVKFEATTDDATEGEDEVASLDCGDEDTAKAVMDTYNEFREGRVIS